MLRKYHSENWLQLTSVAYSRKNKKRLFQKKNIVTVFFPSLGQVSFLLCFTAPTLFSSNLPAVYIGKESRDWLGWAWDPSGADGKLQQLLHNSFPFEAPQSLPRWVCAGRDWPKHNAVRFIRHNRFLLFQLRDGREALSSAGHKKSKFI